MEVSPSSTSSLVESNFLIVLSRCQVTEMCTTIATLASVEIHRPSCQGMLDNLPKERLALKEARRAIAVLKNENHEMARTPTAPFGTRSRLSDRMTLPRASIRDDLNSWDDAAVERLIGEARECNNSSSGSLLPKRVHVTGDWDHFNAFRHTWANIEPSTSRMVEVWNRAGGDSEKALADLLKNREMGANAPPARPRKKDDEDGPGGSEGKVQKRTRFRDPTPSP